MNNLKQPIECLFFDLGNVLVNVHIEKLYKNFSEMTNVPVDRIQDIFGRIKTEHLLYQEGKLEKKIYFNIINKLFEASIKNDNIEKAYCEMFSLNKSVFDLLNRLKDHYTYSIISNTDELHYSYILEEYPELGLFKNNTTSYKAQSLKPGPVIYKKALEKNNIGPDKCLFVDDLAVNVAGAEKMGIKAVQFISVEKLEEDFAKLNIR